MNKSKLPKIIKEVESNFHYKVEEVWGLDLPVEEMDLAELEWHFDIPFWSKSGGNYNLKPNEVLSNLQKYKEEDERTKNADLSFPVDIMFWKNRWLLLDGLHRLVKAKQLGHTRVKVRKIPQEFMPRIRK